MTTMSATEARKQLYQLLDDVARSHEPVQITGKRGNAVLVSRGRLARRPGDALPRLDPRHARVHPGGHGDAGR